MQPMDENEDFYICSIFESEIKRLEKLRDNYLSQKFIPKIPLNEMFTDEDKYIVINYGVWFEALTTDFQCYTDTQTQFANIAKRKDFQNASTEYEKAWVKYLIRLDALTSNDGNMIEDYSSYKEPEEKKVRYF
jgi:hypothetical protein